MSQLDRVYKSLNSVTTVLRPALPFINSHLTEFFTASYWETLLPRTLREDLDLKSIDQIKEQIKDLTNGNWKNYPSSGNTEAFDFSKNGYSFSDLIINAGMHKLSAMNISIPLHELCVNGINIKLDTMTGIDLKFDTIMSAKKTHEVEVMSNLVRRVSRSVLNFNSSASGGAEFPQSIEYLVDVGSGKGYLSSFLTLLYEFKVLAVDSSSINTAGCEKRSTKLEKAWMTLVRRALERKLYGSCTKRGKHWKSKNEKAVKDVDQASDGETRLGIENCGKATKVKINDNENKLLKTLTQFVTPDFDLTESLQENFLCYSSKDLKSLFGLIGLHTCGALGVDSLKLFVANEKAKFICNVPCCYHLLEENPLFYPSRRFEGSKMASKNSDDLVDAILKPGFPISRMLDDAGDHNRVYLGRNARMMSAYSLQRMVNEKNGLDLHSSIFYRCVLQVLIKQSLGDQYYEMENYQYNVGKIGDKCSTFMDYVRRGLENMRLNDKIQPSDEEIERLYHTFEKEKERLHKYYLLRSIFAPLVEGCILLDRLAFLLEQECVQEAFIVELFDAAVSPRSHAIFAYKR